MQTVTRTTGMILEDSNSQGRTRSARIWYWIATSVLAFILLSGGSWLLSSGESMNAGLGFPPYFLQILGVCEILGGIAILVPRFPRLKEWAYAGIVFNMMGASASHAFVGDSPAQIATPLIICGIALVSWSLRPASRKLETKGS